MAVSSGRIGEMKNRLSIAIAAGVVVLTVAISMLVIVLPREDRVPSKSADRTQDPDFFAVPETPRTDDGKQFKPDWN